MLSQVSGDSQLAYGKHGCSCCSKQGLHLNEEQSRVRPQGGHLTQTPPGVPGLARAKEV